jgi:hypothetical protein
MVLTKMEEVMASTIGGLEFVAERCYGCGEDYYLHPGV